MARPMTREAAGPDLAVVIGTGPKGGRKPPGPGMSMNEEPDGDEIGDSEPLPPGFESAAGEAFPDMDPSNYPALKRLIALCMDSDSQGGY